MIREHPSGRWHRQTLCAKEPLRFFLSLLVPDKRLRGDSRWETLLCETREIALTPSHWVVLWVHEADRPYLRTLPLLFR